MKFFDSHCHLPEDGPLDHYLEPLPQAHQFQLLTLGSSLESSRRALTFAETHDSVWCACGVHPHEAEEFDGDVAPFRELYAHDKVRAVGEIGLDFFYDFAPHHRQIKIFEQFLELALEVDKPVAVHCRDAEDRLQAYIECYAMLREYVRSARPGALILHCFAGTPDYLEKFLELGAMIGVTGMVTFKKSDNIRENLRRIPNDRLLVETDSPYLAPVPFRGETNHPAHLPEIVQRIAEEKASSPEIIAELTTGNAERVFRIVSPDAEGK